jgi:hypothetical protein
MTFNATSNLPQQMPSGFNGGRFPLTVAEPRRCCTGLPCYALAGTRMMLFSFQKNTFRTDVPTIARGLRRPNMPERAAAMWTGGKDCSLALYEARKSGLESVSQAAGRSHGPSPSDRHTPAPVGSGMPSMNSCPWLRAWTSVARTGNITAWSWTGRLSRKHFVSQLSRWASGTG